MKASISIFHNKVTDTDSNSVVSDIPNEVFDAAKRVIESKGCELVKTKHGLYIVKYSEYGPFSEKVNDGWMPVYIAKTTQWSSGGITEDEMSDYTNSKQP